LGFHEGALSAASRCALTKREFAHQPQGHAHPQTSKHPFFNIFFKHRCLGEASTSYIPEPLVPAIQVQERAQVSELQPHKCLSNLLHDADHMYSHTCADTGPAKASHGQEGQEGCCPCFTQLGWHGGHPAQPDSASRASSPPAGVYLKPLCFLAAVLTKVCLVNDACNPWPCWVKKSRQVVHLLHNILTKS